MHDDIFSESITTMIAVNEQWILTGGPQGEVVLWQSAQEGKNFNFRFIREFSAHTAAIDKFLLLSNHRFAALCSQEQSITIWNIATGQCEKILNVRGGAVITDRYTALIALEPDLIVVAGSVSPAWTGFDVWDISKNKCLFKGEGRLHIPVGLSLGQVSDDCMAMHGHCNSPLSLWRINHESCSEITHVDDQRIYSMTIGAEGNIITAGYDIKVYQLNSNHTLELCNTMNNSNVIDEMMYIGGHQLLTFDRSWGSGRIKLWDYSSGTDTVLGDSMTTSGKEAQPHCFLKKGKLVLFTDDQKLYVKPLTFTLAPEQNPFNGAQEDARQRSGRFSLMQAPASLPQLAPLPTFTSVSTGIAVYKALTREDGFECYRVTLKYTGVSADQIAPLQQLINHLKEGNAAVLFEPISGSKVTSAKGYPTQLDFEEEEAACLVSNAINAFMQPSPLNLSGCLGGHPSAFFSALPSSPLTNIPTTGLQYNG